MQYWHKISKDNQSQSLCRVISQAQQPRKHIQKSHIKLLGNSREEWCDSNSRGMLIEYLIILKSDLANWS